MPMHFNHKGNKQFNNLQRVSLLILYQRSKKSLVDFVNELKESKWTSWLGLRKIPGKSTLHDWIKLFDLLKVRKINSLLKAKNISLCAIDGTGFDSWQRSRHYAKRILEKNMPYAKVDLFIDADEQIIIDYNLIMKKAHDAKIAKEIFSRNNLSGMEILADKGYDSEPLHELVRSKGGKLLAPVRKMNKVSNKKKPKGKFRRECLNLPEYFGKRSLVETVNSVLKRKQISYLRSKKTFMKQRELGWQIIIYNLNRRIQIGLDQEVQSFIFWRVEIVLFRMEPILSNFHE
jgi:hypothetical protein